MCERFHRHRILAGAAVVTHAVFRPTEARDGNRSGCLERPAAVGVAQQAGASDHCFMEDHLPGVHPADPAPGKGLLLEPGSRAVDQVIAHGQNDGPDIDVIRHQVVRRQGLPHHPELAGFQVSLPLVDGNGASAPATSCRAPDSACNVTLRPFADTCGRRRSPCFPRRPRRQRVSPGSSARRHRRKRRGGSTRGGKGRGRATSIRP